MESQSQMPIDTNEAEPAVAVQDSPPAFEPRRSTTVEGILNTVEWLLVALILALVFRAFGVEAFQIPTGSMAETLKGAHYHLRCIRCGYSYDVGEDTSFYSRPQCPSCGYYQPANAVGRRQNGDRIFVLKCIYQFADPRRWDVVVFKNPTDPQQNYIKRLIGLPGEKIQIIDGDIYINGLIQRKPAKVQNELWMCVYDNDYQPFGAFALVAKTDAQDKENRRWSQPFENTDGSSWNLSADGPTVFSIADTPDRTHTLMYNPGVGNDFHASYAYNNDRLRTGEPICSDLMMRFYVRPKAREGFVGVSLEKNDVNYIGGVEFGKTLFLEKQIGDETVELRRIPVQANDQDVPKYFEFASVDRRLVVRYGTQRLSFDLPLQDQPKRKNKQPVVKILGCGSMKLNHIGLYRDIYYISKGIFRATADKPFLLENDEYFVCGDNSPNSLDGRLWSVEGKDKTGNLFYRQGIVPKDYMMGKAFFVYWSDPFSPAPNMLQIIPNIDRLKIVVGGSDAVY